MKLSIIIPAYNAENNIRESVMSIIDQNVDNLQIIIIDDYSTDKTYTVCKEIQSAFPFIEVYKSIGKGVSDARNTGLKFACGDIIGFCDADDYFEKGVLKNVIEEFQNDLRLELLCYGYNRRNTDGVLLCQKRAKTKYVSSNQMLDRVLNDSRIMGSVWNKFYTKKIIADTFFESSLSYCEDTAFNAVLLMNNKDAKCLIKDTCIYNYVSNMLSATNNSERLFNDSGILKYNESMYYIRNISENVKQRNYVDCAIYRLSVSEYYNNSLKKRQEEILRFEICRHFWVYFASFLKFEPMNNFKILIKGLIIILDGGKGNLYNFVDMVLKAKRKFVKDNE